ncbi:MAG: DUF6279 family lipoprotein [Proteobacteria bacterium]|nr:DUF6279 family lipoprotein [Pseudomonadota bacterium]
MHYCIRLLSILFAAVLLNGCSAVRFSYNNADSLIRWWIDQYADLSPEQDELARERLARFHAWHRKTQLTDYVDLTRQAQKLIAGQPTVADTLALLDGVIRGGMTLADQARPDIADFLLTVTPEQIESVAGRFKRKNADYAKEVQLAGGESGQRKAQLRRVLERTEYWFGDFSDEQNMAVRKIIDGQPIATRFWYDERLRRQREWLDLMRLVQRERPPRDRVIQLLHEYAARYDLPGDPARLLQARTLRRHSAALFVGIHAIATPAQRAHALHKLGDLISDFTALSREE